MSTGNLLQNSTAPNQQPGQPRLQGGPPKAKQRTSRWTVTPPYAADVDIKVMMLGAYLAALSSVSTQILIVYFHLRLTVIAFAQGAAYLAFLASGNFTGFFKSKLAKPWVLLGIWWALAATLGMYRRGSWDTLTPWYLR